MMRVLGITFGLMALSVGGGFGLSIAHGQLVDGSRDKDSVMLALASEPHLPLLSDLTPEAAPKMPAARVASLQMPASLVAETMPSLSPETIRHTGAEHVTPVLLDTLPGRTAIDGNAVLSTRRTILHPVVPGSLTALPEPGTALSQPALPTAPSRSLRPRARTDGAVFTERQELPVTQIPTLARRPVVVRHTDQRDAAPRYVYVAPKTRHRPAPVPGFLMGVYR